MFSGLDKKYNYFVIFLLVFVSAAFLAYIGYFISRINYLPAHEDETIYYNVARLFYLTNSLKGESCIEENFSIIFQANWYGIAYNIFYGCIAKLFGFNNMYFVYVNIIFILFSVFLIYKIESDKLSKISMILFFLMFNMVFTYAFTYFPETINIFFGICLTVVLIRIYKKQEAGKPGWEFSLYVTLCLLFSFFRITWVFWMIGLLPFAKTRFQAAKFIILLFISALAAFLYVQYCCAPPYVVGGSILNELKYFHIWGFVKGFSINIARNLYYFFLLQFKVQFSWMFIKLFYVFIILYLFFNLFMGKNKLLLAVALIFLFNMLVVFSLYSTIYPYFMKITASLFILFFIMIIYLDIKSIRSVVLCILCISFPFVIRETYSTIQQRENTYVQSVSIFSDEVDALKEIAEKVDQNKENIIQRGYYDMDPLPRGVFYTSLPFSNNSGFPIRYSDNMLKDSISYDENFKTFGKIKIDYVLSKRELNRKDIELIYKNNYFYFYKKL